MMKKILLYFFYLLIHYSVTRSQTTSFMNYGVENGLVHGQVQTVTQDNDGNLWIGTIAGLTKYDGVKFHHYTKNDGLAENWITTSLTDSKGNLWFGHWAGNVTRYNVKTKHFENLELENHTAFKSISAIREDESGKYWIATQGGGILIYDSQTFKFVPLNIKNGLLSNNIKDIVFDNHHNAWIASDSGLTQYELVKPSNRPISSTHFKEPDGLFSKHLTCLYYNKNHELLVGSADNGLGVIYLATPSDNWNKDSLLKKQVILNQKNGLGSNFVKCFYEDHNYNMWIGTTGGGSALFIPSQNKNRHLALKEGSFKTYSTKQGLNYFNVNCFFEDREQSLWIGTDIGINQYRGDRIQIYDEADNIPNNIVWSLHSDHENNIWVGTNNGLCKFSFKYENKTEQHVVTNYNEKDGLASNSILACFEDSKHNIWVGTNSAGVGFLTKGSSKFVSYTTKNGLAGNTVYSISEGPDGNIWFGCKEGATCFNPITNQFQTYSTKNGLGGNHIYRIFKDSKGLLWFGALGGNLSVFDGKNFKALNEAHGLNGKFILCINEDNIGNIWFGCYGSGLYKYDGKSFINYTIKNGMTSDSPYSVVADKENNIWIGNSKGIDKLDIKHNQFTHYGKSEGFSGVECNPNAACIDKNNNLWFGTIMGALKFNPSQNYPNKTAPVTKILGLKVHLRDTMFPYDAEFKYNQNYLTFKFIGVSLTNPEKTRYEFSLEGFDHGWIPGNHHVLEANYTNLSPGKYIFKVRSCNNEGIWSEPAMYSFTINPPFWQTAVFYFCIIVFIIFAIYIYDNLRTSKLRVAKLNLEQKVEERTLELAIKNEELAEKNNEVKDSILYAKRIQEASLSNEIQLQKIFPNSFVFNKPKDIVSGDFLWVTQKNNFIYIALVDCTGHGVPGAILSILASTILHKAFDKAQDSSPSVILSKLNELALTALQSSTGNYQLRDGMDIALCKIDTVHKNIEYAGAYNPIFIISNHKLVEYSPDQLSIGSSLGNKTYSNKKFNYQINDQLYLFTDGFPDQYGGEKSTKYGSFALKEFLTKNSSLDSNQQKTCLEKEFINWKGNSEQVDDVLLVGIKL